MRICRLRLDAARYLCLVSPVRWTPHSHTHASPSSTKTKCYTYFHTISIFTRKTIKFNDEVSVCQKCRVRRYRCASANDVASLIPGTRIQTRTRQFNFYSNKQRRRRLVSLPAFRQAAVQQTSSLRRFLWSLLLEWNWTHLIFVGRLNACLTSDLQTENR